LIANVALSAMAVVDPDRVGVYVDLVYKLLSEAAQRSLQAMKPFNYEYQSDFARKYFFEGGAALLVKQLQLKFGPLSDDASARVHSASSKELDAWAERILSAASLDEVFR
jgi:hypothetical protein